jgi:hypothetical protein
LPPPFVTYYVTNSFLPCAPSFPFLAQS